MYILNIDYTYGASSVRCYENYERAKKAYEKAAKDCAVEYCAILDVKGHKLMEYVLPLK